MAKVEKAKMSMLHVWDLPTLDHFGSMKKKKEFKALTKLVLENTEQKMNLLVNEYAHVSVDDYLLKEKPQEVIPKFVEKGSIDLIVMGIVVRSGIPGFFFGNTAEKILNRLDCSVLALKPKGWSSSISTNKRLGT